MAPRSPLRRKLRWKAVGLLVRVFGRPVRCVECDHTLFKAIPYTWGGEVRLLGAHEHLVRVAFRWTYALEFRHVYLDECPSPERPWARAS